MNRHPIEALGILFITAIITSVGSRSCSNGSRIDRSGTRPAWCR